MALVNPNIAMSYRGVEMPQQNMLADYAAIQQIQGSQRQGEVAQMQLEQMRRDQAALSKMQAAITAKGGPSDLNVAAEEMINSGIPEYFKQGLVIKQTLDKQSRFAKLLGGTGGAAPAAPASEAYPGYNESIGMTNALAPAPAAPVNAMDDMRRRINEAYMIGTPEALAFAKAGEDQLKPMTVSPSASVFQGGKSVFTAPAAPVAPAAPPSMVAEYNFAKTKEGGGFKGDYQQFVTARAAAGRAPAAPRPESAPVAVIDPATGKQIYVTREEALRNRMTPASAGDAKALNESQSNATAFGLRMKEADSILEDFAKKGVLKGAVVERTPLIGGVLGQTLPSVLGGTSADQQQVNQAKSNFITAVLRKESGAVISDSEFDREDKKYFPQINDNDQVIKQKAKARKLAIQAIEVQAGPGAKNIREYDPRAGAAGSENDPLGLLKGN